MIWHPSREGLVREALPIIRTLPPSEALRWEAGEPRAEAQRWWDGAERVEAPAIFGGCLIRHFGHFIHESLARLWWLAPEEGLEGAAKEASATLRELEADVYFFMPKWLDQGKDLLPYMEEILALIRLPARRIRILERPLRFRQLWIPACVWGFASNAAVLDQQLGCDSRALMRHLLASADTAPAPEGEPPVEKVYVTRSGLPVSLGRLLGDVVLDPVLEARGYQVFHPERVSLAEQISLYSRANDLIFMDGSSLYLLWFTKLPAGARVRVILRRRQGRWMCEKVRELLPDAGHPRWELVDALRGESLTSTRDWESHNLADLAELSRQLAGEAPTTLPEAATEALAAYTRGLVEESTPEQLARMLQALMGALATRPPKPPSRRIRAYRKARELLTSWRP